MTRKTHRKQNRAIADAMRELGFTDQKLADAVGCDRTWITRIRQGRALPTLKTPLRIAKLLNVPIEALAGKDAA